MAEIWIHTNRRALMVGMVPPVLLVAVGAVIWLLSETDFGLLVGIGSVVAGVLILAVLALQMRQPRVAYANGHVLLNLRPGGPVRLPVDAAEAFFIGQAPSYLPGDAGRSETSTIVLRIAEKAEEWSQVEVKSDLGSWCDGYVIIRGTWCEPVTLDLVNKLNTRLYEVKQAAAGVRS